jgi:hypothetical protein
MSHRDGKYKLSGSVQLDEAFFRAHNGSKAAEPKRPLLRPGNPFAPKQRLWSVPRRRQHWNSPRASLAGCTVTTDGLSIYPQFKDQGHFHERLISSSEETDRTFCWGHTLVSNAKAFLSGTYHGLDQKHLQACLDEYLYRFNLRWQQSKLFACLLTACITGPIVTHADLTS